MRLPGMDQVIQEVTGIQTVLPSNLYSSHRLGLR